MNEVSRTKLEQGVAGLVIIVPPILALWHLLAYGRPDLISTGLCVTMFLLTGFGTTIGLHRYFTHRSFEIPSQWFMYVIGILGLMAFLGWISQFIANHTPHHAHADDEGDLHSPHRYGEGFLATLKGFAYAHVGWFLFGPKAPIPEVLQHDLTIQRLDQLLVLAALAGLLLPACMGALLRDSFDSFFADVVWGGLARMFLVHHATWSVNSVGHLWGTRPFRTNDKSVNNQIVAVFALGEGNQNSHHAFPRSARHGLLPGQLDPTYRVIKALEKLGLVTDVIVPSKEEIAALRA